MVEKSLSTPLPKKINPFSSSFFSKKEIPFAIGCPALIWQIIFFYLPIVIMVFSSVFNITQEGHFKGLTLQHFQSCLNSIHLTIIFQSICVALLTAVICLCIAFPFAYFLAFKGGKYKTLLLFFLIVPFWTNFLLHVCAWFFVLEKNGFLNNLLLSLNLIKEPIHFLNSFFSVMLMMVYHYLPFMILPIYSSLEKFNMSFFEASSDLGATWGQTLKKVLIPLTIPAIRLGFLLVYIPSFGEFVIPELLGGDKHYYAGNVVTQYMLGHHTASLGAAFTVICSFFLVLSILLFLWLTKKLSKTLMGGFQS
jgi:spermidine/putrescine transport system permease protein